MYDDCTIEDARWAYDQLIPESPDVVNEEAALAHNVKPWETIETTYLLCRNDRAIRHDVQQRLATRAHHAIELPTSHSPFLSHPQLVVDALATLAEDARPWPARPLAGR